MIDHDEKQDMLSKGRWIAGAETKHIASFKISELYSPFTTWADMAEDFLKGQKAQRHAQGLRQHASRRDLEG
jgi:hypothetical protein